MVWVSTIPRFQLAPNPFDGIIHRLSGCTDPMSRRPLTQAICELLTMPCTGSLSHGGSRSRTARKSATGFPRLDLFSTMLLSRDPAQRSTSHDTCTHPEFLNRKYHLEPCPCRACVRWPSSRRCRHSKRYSRRQTPHGRAKASRCGEPSTTPFCRSGQLPTLLQGCPARAALSMLLVLPRPATSARHKSLSSHAFSLCK
jgi:hypothetical protein